MAKVGILEEAGHAKAKQPAQFKVFCIHVQSPFLTHFLYTFPMQQSGCLAISLHSHVLPSTFLQEHFKLITHFTFSPVKLTSTAIQPWAVCTPTFSGCNLSLQSDRQIHAPLFLSVPVTTNLPFALFTWDPCQCLCSAQYAQLATSL